MTNEENYRNLVVKTKFDGHLVKGRNGNTRELFGENLKINVKNNLFPMITGRKMFAKGVIGEFLAFIQTKCLDLHDFESRGCNYWKLWADGDGGLRIDYPPGKQLDDIIENIKRDPQSRRHIISLWNHQNLSHLSLPCCHYSYQFNIQGEYINMIWTQRSADLMIGVPSDMLLATLYLNIVAKATGYKPNNIIMNFGSVHIYEEHVKNATDYIFREHYDEPIIKIEDVPYKDLTVDSFVIQNYQSHKKLDFLLKE